MKKKVLSALLTTAMVASMLVGCGSSETATTESSAAAESSVATESSAAAAETTDTASEEGTVLNIYAWNTEFQSRLVSHYPGYEEVDSTTGKIGDVTVKWNITPSDDNAYQNNLDETLLGQADAAADDKIDIFLVEADYALKYVDTDYTMAIADLGITSDELSNQFKYTQDIVTDSNGNLKGVSWQACSAGLIYNRDIALEVFGTEDPDEVQEYVKDWDTFTETAATLKDAGYSIVSTVNDTYRVYSNNVSGKWVQDGKIVVDDNLMNWVNDSKEMVDAGETTTAELWSDDWSQGFYGGVFCYFGPAWLINFSMQADTDGSVANAGRWGLVNGPQSFYWGGTWICAATGTDNETLVADIIRTMTTDETVMTDIVKQDSDCVNNKAVLESLASSDDGNFAVLGGQNAMGVLAAGAENIDLSNLSSYDQGCNEEFQGAMKDYFDGNATLDEALENFYTAVVEKYPELTY